MNRFHRLVWNAACRGWQAVCETARASGKSGPGGAVRRGQAARALLVFAAACTSPLAEAGPQGAQVVLGGGSVEQAGSTTTITQTTQQLAIDWESFNVGAGETVRFVQPNAQSVALNRVLGAEPSNILGRLSANGQVFLLNPNGILFGADARVDVGGLVASTLSMTNADFAAGRFHLQGPDRAGVSNAGRITAAEGGYVVLAAPQVQNTGAITTRLGTTALAAGEHVTLQLQGGSLLGYRIERGALAALVEQAGRISADGGSVLIEARALDALSSAVVNHTGISQARAVQAQEGRIVLMGDLSVGRTTVAGTLDASAPEGGNGGFIETSAAAVKVDDQAVITTRSESGSHGLWLVDPTDFTIAASGGDISGTALSAALANGNVTLDSTLGASAGSGNLYVRDEVRWSANRLTLRAQADVHIYRDLVGTDSARLALELGLATADGAGSDYHLHNASRVHLPEGRNFSIRKGSTGAIREFQVVTRMISSGVPGEVSYQDINNNTAGLYALGGSLFAPFAGQTPLGGLGGTFSGEFHGLGHSINGLRIGASDPGGPTGTYATWGIAMFGTLGAGAVARDFGLVGGLVQFNGVNRSFITGHVGAVAGTNHGLIHKVHSTTQIYGREHRSSGGLVGLNFGTVRQSMWDGWVGETFVTSGDASEWTGSLVGINRGLLEDSFTPKSFSNPVTSVVGTDSSGQTNRVYQMKTGYQVTDNRTTRTLTEAEMTNPDSFAGWDIGSDPDGDSIWRIHPGSAAPVLRDLRRRVVVNDRFTFDGQVQSNGYASGINAGVYAAAVDTSPLGQEVTGAMVIAPAALTVSSADVSREYDGTTNASRAQAVVVGGTLFGSDTLAGGRFSFADADAGSGKTVLVSDVRVSDGNGGANYTLTLVNNTSSTITPAPLEISVQRTRKTYDGSTDASAAWSLSRGRLLGGHTLSGVRFQFDNANAGDGKSLLLDSAVINDGNGGANYTLSLAANSTSSITPAELVVTARDDQRVEGGQPYQGGAGFTTRGLVAGEDDRWLQGAVLYGGTSQGARAPGRYSIAPGGLSSANYSLRFENGELVISALPPVVVVPVDPSLPPPTQPPVSSVSPLPVLPNLPVVPDEMPRDRTQTTTSGSAETIAVLDCGMRLPTVAPGDDCR